jgi:hypothetical protein
METVETSRPSDGRGDDSLTSRCGAVAAPDCAIDGRKLLGQSRALVSYSSIH